MSFLVYIALRRAPSTVYYFVAQVAGETPPPSPRWHRASAQVRAGKSDRGPSVRWASADCPVASGDDVALSNWSTMLVAR